VNNGTGRSRQVALDGYMGRFFESPCEPSPVSGVRTVKLSSSPLVEEGVEGMRTGAGFLKAPASHLPFQAAGRSNSPLLPLWEKGAEGMRGKSAQECRKSLISPKKSTLERQRG
jgi:hypothetical protein